MIAAKNVTITTAATLIHKAASNGCRLHIYCASGGEDVTLGPASVAAGTGYILPSSSKTENDFDIPPGDSLYGIVASSTKAINVLVVEF